MKKNIIKSLIRSRIIRLFNRYTLNRPVVFMLHRFHDPTIGYTGDDDAISPDQLERFFAYLRANNYNIITLRELVRKAGGHVDLYKTVCFTVDDGYIDFKHTAFPLCKAYDVPMTVFITTDFISGRIMMWWDKIEYLVNNTQERSFKISLPAPINQMALPLQSGRDKKHAAQLLVSSLKVLPQDTLMACIQNLSDSLAVALPEKPPPAYSALTWEDARLMKAQYIDFEPHTVNHPILSRINPAAQQQQIRDSIRAIRDNLKSEPTVYCYPNGTEEDFTQETIATVQSEGMLAACTTIRGCWDLRTGDVQPFMIPRVPFPRSYEQSVLWASGYRSAFAA